MNCQEVRHEPTDVGQRLPRGDRGGHAGRGKPHHLPAMRHVRGIVPFGRGYGHTRRKLFAWEVRAKVVFFLAGR